MGKKPRTGLPLLILAAGILSGCCEQMRDDWSVLRPNGSPEDALAYAARLQAKKEQSQKQDRAGSEEDTGTASK
jgi:hypothetical protein